MNDKQRTVTVDLEYPLEVEGQVISSLTFRRMKAKDTLVAEDEPNKARAGYLMFAALANVSLSVIEELDIEDLEKIGEAVVPLMGKSAQAARKTMGQSKSDGET